jgi:hypothetical protein
MMVTSPGHTPGMCDIGDGMTHEQSLRRMDDVVAAHGWAIQGVEGSGHQPPWAYTIGLIERFGRPELVVTDCTWPVAVALLNDLGDRVAAGARLTVGDVVRCDAGRVELATVHPGHLLHGLCASWTNYYEWRGEDLGPLEVLHVVPATERADAARTLRRRDLSTLGAMHASGGPPRAARRRAARRRAARRR